MRALYVLLQVALVLGSSPLAAQGQTAEEAVASYGAAWSETDAELRLALLEKAWADEGVYSDPTAEVTGREALSAHIGGFLEQMNGARIVLTSGVDSHHGNRLRFSWKLVAGDGKTTISEGFDYAELDGDGRLRLIVGFFGPFPPLEEASSAP